MGSKVHICFRYKERRYMKGIKLWGQCRTVGSKQIVIPSKLREMKIVCLNRGFCPCVFGMVEIELRWKSPLLKCNAKGTLFMQGYFLCGFFCLFFCFFVFFSAIIKKIICMELKSLPYVYSLMGIITVLCKGFVMQYA